MVISVNELFGLDSEFNPFDPKFKRVPGIATETAPVSLTEELRNQYNARNEIKLEPGQLPPQLPLEPETIQTGKPTTQRAAESVVSTVETGAGYFNQAVRDHAKFLTDVGEGIRGAASGAVTSAAGMARASSDVLNEYAGRFAREGPKAFIPGTESARLLRDPGQAPLPVPTQDRSPTFYRDTFKKMEDDTKAWSYEPKTKVGQGTLAAIGVVPHLIKEASDFIGRRAEDIGLDPDRARLVSFASELALFWGLDKGLRAGVPEARARINDFRSKVKSTKTDADLLSPAVVESAEKLAEVVDRNPKIATELESARSRLDTAIKKQEPGPEVEVDAPRASLDARLTRARTTADDLGVSEDIVRLTGEGRKYGAVADAIKDRLPADMPRIQQLNLVRDTERAYREGIGAAPKVPAPEQPGAVSAYLANRQIPPNPTEVVSTPLPSRSYPEVPVRRPAQEAAAVTIPETVPAPVTREIPVAAAAPRQEIVRELYAKSLDKNATTKEVNTSLGELKAYAREGMKPSGKTEAGLERLGFTEEQIADLSPRLKNVRAEKVEFPPAENVPATSTSTQITPPEAAVPAVTRLPLSDLSTRPPHGIPNIDEVRAGEGILPGRQTPAETRIAELTAEVDRIRTEDQIQQAEITRINTELAKPDIQLTQTPDGDVAYVKPTGEVIAKVADTPAQVELAKSPPGTEVILPPERGIVDTTPFIEKPKRQRKVVKAKPETDPLPNETEVGIEPRPTTASELGLPATAGETRYYSTNLNSLVDTMRGTTGEVVGTVAPERTALQVRRTGSAKPDAVFVDTGGMNTLTSFADIEKQVARGRMSKETGDAMIAGLRRQAEVSGEPLATAHIWNGQRLYDTAVQMAHAEGLDLYVKKGKDYELMPRDAVSAESKLASTDITQSYKVTRAEVAALTDFKSGPIGPEALKEILESAERGLDISDRLPADLVPHYKSLVERERQGINVSERRNFIDILKDLNTLLGESGAVGPRGPGIFNRERRLAAQRLEADTRRIGETFTNFFRNTLPTDQIPMFERYLERISNPEPPKGVGPQRMSFDTVAGDQIVKHRIRSDGKVQGVPLWESEVKPMYELRNIGQSTFRGLENPIYLMERLGAKEYYYAARSALSDYQATKSTLSKDLKAMQSNFGPKSRENIGAYAYSKTPQGMKILENMGKEVPTLNAKELRAYNEIRAIYDDFFERINEVREATGHEPLMKIDDYFTFARTYSVMERLGVTPDIMRQAPADVNAAFVKYSTTPFPHQRIRKGSTYAAELDAFRLLDTYSNTALRQIHVAPFVAKMYELLETKLPDPKQTATPWKMRDQNWMLKEENANAYNVLNAWTNYIATGRSPDFKLPTKVENTISWLSSNLAYSLLSGTIRSAGVQVSTMRNTLQALGPTTTIEGILRSIADPVKRWDRAMEKSEVLSSRRFQDAFQGMDFSLQGLRPREIAGAVSRGRITELQSAIGAAGLKPLEWMDMAASNVSWNAAYDAAIKKLGKTDRDAIRFADDLVVKTQGSTMPNDVAAIQRSVAGKALTQFQTFLISDFNFLTREVIGMRDPRMSNKQKIMNIAQFVGTTMAFNVLFEDVLHMQSPFPTLVKDAQQAAAKDTTTGAMAWRLASGALEVFPIIGASRYGKGFAGPIAEEAREFTRGMAGSPLAPNPFEVGAKLAGIPGTQQIAKFSRAQKRGENFYDSMLGWYSQDRATITRSRRTGRTRE